ncbi:MAG: CoA transferase [Chloroflexi bacterium]|nr:CoA transferase [Chloroflexota bacterium]
MLHSVQHDRHLPLRHLRVANFGWVWAAPALGHLMADMGAEVVKVESEARMDIMRWAGMTLRDAPNQTFNFHSIQRSCGSLTVDLAKPEAVELTKAFIEQCDLVIENYRPGTMARFGLSYEDLRRIRPDLIFISLSAAGQDGPLRGITTFGSSLGSLTGLDALQGYYDNRPIPAGMALPDPFNGILGLYAVLAAVRHRRETGEGEYIDLSQWEATTCTIGAPLLDWQMNERIEGTRGNRDPMHAPHNVYPCQGGDRWVAIAVKTEAEWRAFCDALGSPSWTRDSRFTDAFRRIRNQDALDEHIAAWTRERTNTEVMRILQGAGVSAAPAFSCEELFADEHFLERRAWEEVQHPYGTETVYGVHWKFSETPGRIRQGSPLLGQDNERVACELLGLPEDALRRWQRERVVF